MTTAKPKPQVSPEVRRQREHLVTLQHTTQRQIRSAYRDARRALTPALRRFAGAYGAELARVRSAAGEDADGTERVSLLWLHTSGHLQALRAPTMASLRYAATRSTAATTNGQRDAFTAGQIAGTELIADMLATAGGPSAPEDTTTTTEDDITTADTPPSRYGVSGWNGQPLSSFFDNLAPDAWQRIEKAVNAATVSGQSDEALFAALLAAGLDQSEVRALLIGDTELTSAFRDAMSIQYEANASVVGAWMWVAMPDACDECVTMSGTIHDVTEGLDSHPRCRCIQVPLDQPGQMFGPDDFTSIGADQLGLIYQGQLNAAGVSRLADLAGTGSLNDMPS